MTEQRKKYRINDPQGIVVYSDGGQVREIPLDQIAAVESAVLRSVSNLNTLANLYEADDDPATSIALRFVRDTLLGKNDGQLPQALDTGEPDEYVTIDAIEEVAVKPSELEVGEQFDADGSEADVSQRTPEEWKAILDAKRDDA